MRATLSRGSPSSGHVCSARCPGNQQWGARTYKERDRECVGLLILTAVPSVVIYTVREYQTFVDGTDSCQIERQTERELLTSFLVYTTLGSTVGSSSLLCRTATHCNTLRHTATHCNTLQHTAIHCNTLQPLLRSYNEFSPIRREKKADDGQSSIHDTRGGGLGSSTISKNLMSPTPRRKWYLTTGRRAH